MSGIITFGVEWETSLLVANTTGSAHFFEKRPYYLGNRNQNPYLQYSLERYHPPRSRVNQRDKTQDYENAKVGNRCMYSLEFIFGVFHNLDQFSDSIADFFNIIIRTLCTDDPQLEITQADGETQSYPIVAIVDNPQIATHSDCTLKRAKLPDQGVGVRFANHCPITGKGQITIGIDFESTYLLFAYMVHTPLMRDPSMALSKKQNFRDSAFKMTSYFLYHIMGGSLPEDPIVQALCFWMVYPIINYYRSIQFKKDIEYFKMLLPLKGRSNFTCLVNQLSREQQAQFYQWYNTNYSFLGKFFPKVWGYRFSQSYPDYNINEKYIYSAEVYTSPGLGNIAVQGNQISFMYNHQSYTRSLLQPVLLGEFIVWNGRLTQLEANFSPEHSNIIFQGLGNPAFESADVNEWYIEPTLQGSTYNVVEVRELDKFYQNGLNFMPKMDTDNLEQVTLNVLTNLGRITTTYNSPLQISEQEYEKYVAEYMQFDAIVQEAENAKARSEGREAEEINTVQTKIVNALAAAVSDYVSDYNGGVVPYDEINWEEIDWDIPRDMVLDDSLSN